MLVNSLPAGDLDLSPLDGDDCRLSTHFTGWLDPIPLFDETNPDDEVTGTL